MSAYSIHDSKTGNLIRNIEVEGDQKDMVEWVSGDNPEGHFAANRVESLEDLGDVSVYAIHH
jgi:hypothetical protein